jgi:hypothetical protein
MKVGRAKAWSVTTDDQQTWIIDGYHEEES